jgi:hypothetical protein
MTQAPAANEPMGVSIPDSIQRKFLRLRDQWLSERGPESSTSRLVLHPAYQTIIGMGSDAIPLLLRELEQRPDAWFWALRAITEENPVPAQAAGDGQAMAKAWIRWGKERGFEW